jgi:hypothetical protein
MKRFKLATLGLAAALSAAVVGPVAAEDEESSFVRQHAIELLEGALTPEQTATLQVLANQAAIAAVCEGFVLDDAKFQSAFEKLAPVDADKMTDEQKKYHDGHILVIYGVLVGGELAAMADDDGEACAVAAEAKADPDFADDMVWKK